MADNLNKKGKPDSQRINLNQPHEVQYWTKELGVTKTQLVAVVQKVGSSVSKVRKEISK